MSNTPERRSTSLHVLPRNRSLEAEGNHSTLEKDTAREALLLRIQHAAEKGIETCKEVEQQLTTAADMISFQSEPE
jgi:hypothetical protein